MLARLGTGAALVGALRASRAVILPLWALSIGVDAVTTALIIGVAGAVDFALFYLGGYIMDRFGRLWTAVPSMIGLGAGHLLLAFTHDVASNVEWFIAAAMVLSVANGLGSGILMTLGSDLADNSNPAPFLGAWRFTSGVGGASAPAADRGHHRGEFGRSCGRSDGSIRDARRRRPRALRAALHRATAISSRV